MLDILRNSTRNLLGSLTVPSVHRLFQLNFLLSTFLLPSPYSTPQQQRPQIQIQSCPSQSLSCPLGPPTGLDTCCINSPSGHFLLAQFWDTSPALGPVDSWTLHGLWPDLCTGGFDQFCDDSRTLSLAEINEIVDAASDSTVDSDGHGVRISDEGTDSDLSLRGYMDRYWKGLSGDDVLWMHEWNKHGTCVSTLTPQCFRPGYYPPSSSSPSIKDSNHSDVVDYFTAATSLHSTLHTHSVLAAHGITPSTTRTYTLAAIQAALGAAHHGHPGTVKCNYRGELNEIWMHYLIVGSAPRGFGTARARTGTGAGTGATSTSTAPGLDEAFVPVSPDGMVSNCPKTGIRYLPKGRRPPVIPEPVPTGRPFEGKGYLKVHVVGDSDGSSPVDRLAIHHSDIDIDIDTDTDVHEIDFGDTATGTDQGGDGCLLRLGRWYTSGTCATFHPSTVVSDDDDDDDDDVDGSHLFTLRSSAGPCTFLRADGELGKEGEFVCAKSLPHVPSIFQSTLAEGHRLLGVDGQTRFFAEQNPKKFQKVKVFSDKADGERNVQLEIHWEGV